MRKHLFIIFCALSICAVSPAAADTYRILAVRVDFPYEEPDHYTTSGRGTFDLRDFHDSTETSLRDQYRNPWDVPPHNRAYFESHLTALANYWRTVSEDAVSIEYEIWPRESDAAYTLSKKFYKYGNGRSTEETYEKLVELVVEAVTAAEGVDGDSIDFSAFDTFMIIHAGIGSETSGELNDIPSAYVSRDDILAYHGSPFSVDGREITNGIIVPEMASDNGVGGLNGIMAQMFGHRLGLPSMSNNEDGLPAAGGWCLMDTGSMAWGANTRGFVPTHPCAWSKMELGFIEPVTVTSDATVDIAATHLTTTAAKAVKIPLGGEEYLLIENRRRYAPRDSLAQATRSEANGVWLSAEHYDAYVPGSGILVWHIHEGIIRGKRDDNAINNDLYRRGIDLLEADGREDIGALVGFGDDRGAYTEGHDDDTFKAGEVDEIGPDTLPDTDSIWGGDTGVTIRVVSDVADTMRVEIHFDDYFNNFSLPFAAHNIITAHDMANVVPGNEVIVSSSDSVYIYDSTGALMFSDGSTGHPAVATDAFASTLYIPRGNELLACRGDAAGNIRAEKVYPLPPGCHTVGGTVVTDFLSMPSVLFVARNDAGGDYSLCRLDCTAESVERLWTLDSSSGIASIASNGALTAIVDSAAVVSLFTPDSVEPAVFQIDTETLSDPLIADFDRDGAYECVVAHDSQIDILTVDGERREIGLDFPAAGSPAACDIDGDGYPEIVLVTGSQIAAFRRNGIPQVGFPQRIPPGNKDERFTTGPIIADIDGSGTPDILAVTSAGRAIAYDGVDGVVLDGFPLLLAETADGMPALIRSRDEANDAVIYGLVYGHDDGIAARGIGGDVVWDSRVWTMRHGAASLGGSLSNDDIPSDTPATAPFEAYCYPNPVTGGSATIRIVPTEDTYCDITLYTADGVRVWEHRMPSGDMLPGVANEMTLPAADLGSGLYIARIETRSRTIFYKIGVVK